MKREVVVGTNSLRPTGTMTINDIPFAPLFYERRGFALFTIFTISTRYSI